MSFLSLLSAGSAESEGMKLSKNKAVSVFYQNFNFLY